MQLSNLLYKSTIFAILMTIIIIMHFSGVLSVPPQLAACIAAWEHQLTFDMQLGTPFQGLIQQIKQRKETKKSLCKPSEEHPVCYTLYVRLVGWKVVLATLQYIEPLVSTVPPPGTNHHGKVPGFKLIVSDIH